MPRLSPDGKFVVYHWDGRRRDEDTPNWDIYVQPTEGGGPTRLTEDSTAETQPAWSPDGDRIAFVQNIGPDRNRIRVIPILGGPQQTVSPQDVLVNPGSIDWSPDGKSIAFTFFPDTSGRPGLALLSLDTGRVIQLTAPQKGMNGDRAPRFSPDGQTNAFFRNATIAGSYGDLFTIPVTGGHERPITSGGRGIQGHAWTADGRELVFSSNRSGY